MAIPKLLKDSLEDNTLTQLCWDFEDAPKIAAQVSEELFSTREYQRIAKYAIEHVNRYGLPPRGHLRDYLEQELRHRDGQFLKQIIDAMETLHPELQGRFVQDDLDVFIQRRTFAMALDTAYDRLDKNDLAGARDALYSASAVVKPQPGVWLHDTEKWLAFTQRRQGIEFSSGCDTLDDRGIHPARKEVYLHMGPRKSGKTWALIQQGRRAVENRQDALHITLENSSIITQERYTQSFLQMTLEQTRSLHIPVFAFDGAGRFRLDHEQITPRALREAGYDELAEKLARFQYTGRVGSMGRLLIQEYPTGSLTLAQLNHLLDNLERTENFVPGLIIVDYVNLMDLGDVRQHRLSLGRMGVGLRGIAVARNAAVSTATQTNRLSVNAKLITGAHVAEDWSLLGTVDTAVTYTQSPQERLGNRARLFVDACRTAPDKWTAQITQSYAIGQFCLDSIYMNKEVTEAIRLWDEEHEGEDSEGFSDTGYAQRYADA